jgi:signal peptidase I
MDAQMHDEVRCGLAAEALRSWGTLQLRATGISMLPTLWPGDLLTIHSLRPEQAKIGEIVLYMRQGRFFIHRVASRDATLDETPLITRGDCMSEDDSPVGRHELLGRITEVRRGAAVFVPARKLSLFSKIVAWMFCHWGLFRRAGLRLWTYRQLPLCSSVSSVVQGFSTQASAGNGAAGN